MDESLAAGSHVYLYLFIVDVRDVLRRHRKKLRMCVWSGRFICLVQCQRKTWVAQLRRTHRIWLTCDVHAICFAPSEQRCRRLIGLN